MTDTMKPLTMTQEEWDEWCVRAYRHRPVIRECEAQMRANAPANCWGGSCDQAKTEASEED